MDDFPYWSVAWIVGTAIVCACWLKYLQYREDQKEYSKSFEAKTGCGCEPNRVVSEPEQLSLFTDAELNQMIEDENGPWDWSEDEFEIQADKDEERRRSEENVEQLRRQETQIRTAWRDGNNQPRRVSL